MNKKIFVPVFALVLLLPTLIILMILVFFPRSDSTVFRDGEGVLKVTDDKKYFFSSENDENSYLFDLFFSIEERSTRSDLAPEDISGEHKYTVEFKDKEKIRSLTFVPSLSEPCLWYNENNEVYTLSKSDSDSFINSEYAWTLYKNGKAPSLKSSLSITINPKQAEWTYSSQNGSLVKGVTDRITDKLDTYNAHMVSLFSFEIPPDRCTVRAYADSVKIYEGSIEGVESSVVSSHALVRFEIDATWSRSPDSEYFGSAKYEFFIKRFKLSDVSVDTNEIEAGGFVLAKITNVDDPESIRFSSSKPINTTPVFYKRGDIVYSLIAFPANLESGTYTLEFSYGISSESVNITIKEKSQIAKLSSLTPANVLNAENFAKLNKLIRDVGSDISSQIYISDGFYNYEEKGFTVYLGFNNAWIYADKSAFTQIGVDFSSAFGENIPAFNAGVVCDSGEDAILGKYVVIDHGYGLKSWYGHLSAVTVSVGDTVKKGDIVARTGTSELTDLPGFYFITTIGGTPVSPYKLYENDFVIK